jgi:hypothetical protein
LIIVRERTNFRAAGKAALFRAMRRNGLFFLTLLLIAPVGCIATRPFGHAPSYAARVIPDVPVKHWGDNSCGSGALSTVLNHYGDAVTEKELDASLDKGLHGGVVSVDLLLEARRRGFDAELVPGDEELVRTRVGEGKPVILMLRVVNMPFKRNDLFHYIVVDGYDPERKLFHMQFGSGKPRWAPLTTLATSWRAVGRATLVVHGRSSTALSNEEQLRRAVLLQEEGKLAAASAIYTQLAERAPSPLLFTNLGNAKRDANERDAAESAYRQALSLDPNYRDALNNLAWLLYEEKRLDDAAALARQAARLPGPDSYLVFDTLGTIELALHNCDAAFAALQRAAEETPKSEAAAAAAKVDEARKNCAK